MGSLPCCRAHLEVPALCARQRVDWCRQPAASGVSNRHECFFILHILRIVACCCIQAPADHLGQLSLATKAVNTWMPGCRVSCARVSCVSLVHPAAAPQQHRSSTAEAPQQHCCSTAEPSQQHRSSIAEAPQQHRSSTAAAPQQHCRSTAAAPQCSRLHAHLLLSTGSSPSSTAA
jgi:hypothetical protein